VRGAAETVPQELVDFMETFRCPDSTDPQAFLSRFVEWQNAGGPEVTVERGLPMGHLQDWRMGADVYVPDGSGPHTTMLLLHGGAWVMGAPATHDRMAREFAARGFLVFSADYPRAPRWRFPLAYAGCSQALSWVRSNAAAYGGTAEVVIAGDSAGANLAAAVAATTRHTVAALALMYGIYDFHRALPVIGPLLGGPSPDDQQYVAPSEFTRLRGDPRLSPGSCAAALPAAWLAAGSKDPLAPETFSLASLLQTAKTDVELYIAEGQPHSFMQMPGSPHYASAFDSASAFLRKHSKSAARPSDQRSQT
jgi:acetyl esterase